MRTFDNDLAMRLAMEISGLFLSVILLYAFT